MVRAYVLIQTEVGQTGRVAGEVAEIEGTDSTVPVAGPYDVIATVEASSIDALGKMVVSRIQGVRGVTRTLTCTVVRAGLPPIQLTRGVESHQAARATSWMVSNSIGVSLPRAR
jgi:hypothetical protein